MSRVREHLERIPESAAMGDPVELRLHDVLVRPSHLSVSGPTTCRHSAGKSLLLQLVLPGSDGRSGVEKSTAAGPSASDEHWSVYAWGVRSRLGGDTSTGSDLTPHWLLNNVVRQNT